MEEFKIGQLTKELVAIEVKKMADPCAKAASLVKQTIAVALKSSLPSGTDLDAVVEDACRGGMTGLLLADQNLPKGAALILEAVCELAAEANLDPTAVMRRALLGIADLRRFLTPDQLHAIQHEIESHYMGAGEAFAQCVKQGTEAKPAQG